MQRCNQTDMRAIYMQVYMQKDDRRRDKWERESWREREREREIDIQSDREWEPKVKWMEIVVRSNIETLENSKLKSCEKKSLS